MAISPEKLLLGAHTSTAGGVHNALLQGKEIGATTIQLFTSNQRQWKGRLIDPAIVDLWKATQKETGIKTVMSHDSYLINLGSCDPEMLAKSRQAFQDELARCHALDIAFLNFHPGAACGAAEEECLDTIVESLLQLEKLCQNGTTRLLLELTAGQGTAVGWKFEHTGYILERVKKRIPIGACIDTCHIFAAGYDIRTPEACDATLNEFDRVVGLDRLYAFHLNDSKKPLGSRVDRHAHLGKGEIGIDCFKWLMHNKRLRDLPKYLETPEGPTMWVKEIAMLREFAK